MSLLSVRNVRVEFAAAAGNVTALHDVSFDIEAGEVLGVVGESGAGKSLTAWAIGGLLQHPGRMTGGEIHLDGRRIDTLSERERRKIRGRRIGMIFQDPLTSLDPLFTVGDQLVETMLTHLDISRAAAERRAVDLLREVGIPAAERRIGDLPHVFSGGMRQRVVIALALCAEPEVLIADEPTTALDVSVQAQIIALLRRVSMERRMAVMLVTHDMGVVAETADRVAVMYAGRVIEIGAVADVLERPFHPYTRGLMGAIPPIDSDAERLDQIPGSMPRLTHIPAGCSFHPRCGSCMPVCRTQLPASTRMASGRVACHLVSHASEAIA